MLVSFGLRVFLLESAGGLGSPEQRLTVRGEKAFKATENGLNLLKKPRRFADIWPKKAL